MVSDGDLLIFLTDAEVAAARKHVEDCRKGKSTSASNRTSRKVPSGALDECKESYHAAQERADDEDDGKYDAKGLQAVSCRHDVPLFLCDIQTPGERQYFAIALIIKVDSMLPSNATMGVLYDIACQTDRSVALVSRLYFLEVRLASENTSTSTTLFPRSHLGLCSLWLSSTLRDISGYAKWLSTHGSESALGGQTERETNAFGP